MKEQLAGLGPAELAGREGQDLQTRLQELELAAAGSSSPVVQIDRAKPPAEASSPKPVQNTVIGAIVGLALGLALAIALERRDRRVRDPRFMEYVLGGPIIGRIPRSRALARSGRGTRALPAPEAEAFRTVRVNLRRQLEQQGARSLIVTSAIPGEGKTTLAWNLARIEAAAGSRVLLVEADLRRPGLARSLEANGTAGLTELLASDEAQLQDLIHPVDFGRRRRPRRRRGRRDRRPLRRAPPANPAELLDSERMQAMLEVIPDRYDLVVVDTPPTVVSDAMPILEYVGGVVVVGRIGLSTDESLIGLREQLDHLDAPTLGVVVNGDAKSSDAYTTTRRGTDEMSAERLAPHEIPVVILAGGMGTRLREETEKVPKPLVEIGDKPILWHIMKIYGHHGFQRFVLCLGYKSWLIKEYFLRYREQVSDFTIAMNGEPPAGVPRQPRRRGLGGHVRRDRPQRRPAPACGASATTSTTDTFMFTYGDGLGDVDIGALLDFHYEQGRIGTVTGVHPTSRYGEMRGGRRRRDRVQREAHRGRGLRERRLLRLPARVLRLPERRPPAVLRARAAPQGWPATASWRCSPTRASGWGWTPTASSPSSTSSGHEATPPGRSGATSPRPRASGRPRRPASA